MKSSIKTVLVLLVICASMPVYAQTCAGMSLGNGASLNGFVPFPATNLWNTNIANAPLDPQSEAITAAPGFAGLHLHPDFGSDMSYGIPYVVVDSTVTPFVPINVIDYPDQSDVLVAPYPATAPLEGLPTDCSGWPDDYVGDSHTLVLDRAQCVLYETWNTHRCHGQWTSSSETIWDMTNGESRPYGWTSADAGGLPIFPGLIRYDEVASGAIHHAIRFTLAHTKNDANGGYFVAPAVHAAGTEWGVSNIMGMRIRLKASFDISGYSAANRVILTAMKQYGMILADNGSSIYFSGVSDPRWNDDDLSNLKQIGSENFEVVKMAPAFPGYDSETAPTGAPPAIGKFTASAASVTSGSAVTFTYAASGDSYDYIDMIGPVKAGSGTVTISPKATQTYTLNSTNAYGRTAASITVTVPGSVVAVPVFTPPGGAYTTPQTVTISTATSPAATIYYTVDGSVPTTKSKVFSMSNPIPVSATEVLQAIAVVYGYTAPSAVGSSLYTIAGLAGKPAFNPAAGTYPVSQAVTISSATPSATIYYTTNGTSPTTGSTKYTGAITVQATETISAIAAAKGLTNSSVASAAYTINLPAAATPTFTPAGGTYTTLQTVTIKSATANATIVYTTDGSDPTTSATRTVYTVPITVNKTETLKAFADYPGHTVNSAVGSATYTFNLPTTATPVFSVGAGMYEAVQSVALSDATAGAAIYYTTDGTEPTASSTKYTGTLTVSSTKTIRAIAFATGFANSAVASAAYTIAGSPTALAAPATPVSATAFKLNAIVNAQGLAGSYLFQYGTSATALTSSTAAKALSASSNPVAVSTQVNGLNAGAQYYYRVVVSTAGGSATGAVLLTPAD